MFFNGDLTIDADDVDIVVFVNFEPKSHTFLFSISSSSSDKNASSIPFK
jgi:hypothetical protein